MSKENRARLAEVIRTGRHSLKLLRTIGFTFGPRLESRAFLDDDHEYMDLPPGWTVHEDPDSHWLVIRDRNGEDRLRPFRDEKKGNLHVFEPDKRFWVAPPEPGNGIIDGHAYCAAWDRNRVVHVTEGFRCRDGRPFDGTAFNLAYDAARVWLFEAFPSWEDPLAYWDHLDVEFQGLIAFL